MAEEGGAPVEAVVADVVDPVRVDVGDRVGQRGPDRQGVPSHPGLLPAAHAVGVRNQSGLEDGGHDRFEVGGVEDLEELQYPFVPGRRSESRPLEEVGVAEARVAPDGEAVPQEDGGLVVARRGVVQRLVERPHPGWLGT